MKVGVLSKTGISFTSKPILIDNQTATQKVIKEDAYLPFKKFLELKEKLILSDTGRLKQRLTYQEKLPIFNEINTLLLKSEKNSMLSYIYSNEQELIFAQKELIDLGMHCLEFAEFVDFQEKEYYYQALCQIFKRSELDLGQIGFSTINQAQTNNGDKNSRDLYKKKIKVASSYQ